MANIDIRYLNQTATRLSGFPMAGSRDRRLGVLLPYQFDERKAYPSIWFLGGFASSGTDMLNDGGPFKLSFAHQLLEYQREGTIAPFFAFFPDCTSELGGSQFINSTANGPFMDYLCTELLETVNEAYPSVSRDSESRVLCGHSSGGYGALMTAMERPGVFSGVVASAADSYFEMTQLPAWLTTAVEIKRVGGLDSFLSSFRASASKGKISQNQFVANMQLAMACCYSPTPGENSVHAEFPVDFDSLSLNKGVWQRWLNLDPSKLVSQRGEALSCLSHIHLDCGKWDECGAQFGHRLIHQSLVKQGIDHHFDEFSGSHRNTSFRYEARLALVAREMPAFRSR